MIQSTSPKHWARWRDLPKPERSIWMAPSPKLRCPIELESSPTCDGLVETLGEVYEEGNESWA